MIKDSQSSNCGRFIRSLVAKANFTKDGKPYSANRSGTNNIAGQLEDLMATRDDPSFISKIWEGSLGKLVWEDGYFDFSLGEKGEFVEGFKDANGEDIHFVHIIRRKFPRQWDPEMRKELEEKYEQRIFANSDFTKEFHQGGSRGGQARSHL